jgi:hypothetical protein
MNADTSVVCKASEYTILNSVKAGACVSTPVVSYWTNFGNVFI